MTTPNCTANEKSYREVCLMQKSCYHCTHWKLLHRGVILWDFAAPPESEFECDIDRVHRQWPNLS
jgi:hypothetical protein